MQYTPISLGYTCETKFQLARARFVAEGPASVEEFRRALYGVNSDAFGKHLFDWQITPLSAVGECLARDFEGVFEREDLWLDPSTGEVTHRELGTRHPHSFPAITGEQISPEHIDRHYPHARARFDHQASRFRELLKTTGQFLYVYRSNPAPADVERVLKLLSRHPGHEVHMLLVYDQPGPDVAHLDRVSTHVIAWGSEAKGPGSQWEGDDAAWDAALAPFPLTPPVLVTTYA